MTGRESSELVGVTEESVFTTHISVMRKETGCLDLNLSIVGQGLNKGGDQNKILSKLPN